jgi:hypothetical protein
LAREVTQDVDTIPSSVDVEHIKDSDWAMSSLRFFFAKILGKSTFQDFTGKVWKNLNNCDSSFSATLYH